MDAQLIINMHMVTFNARKEVLRKSFLAELQSLIDEAKTALEHRTGPLPELAWLKTSIDRLHQLYAAFEKEELACGVLTRVSQAAGFDAPRPAEG